MITSFYLESFRTLCEFPRTVTMKTCCSVSVYPRPSALQDQVNLPKRFVSASRAVEPKDDWMLLLLWRLECYLLYILAAHQSWSTFYGMTGSHVPHCSQCVFAVYFRLGTSQVVTQLAFAADRPEFPGARLGWREMEGVGVVKPLLTQPHQPSPA